MDCCFSWSLPAIFCLVGVFLVLAFFTSAPCHCGLWSALCDVAVPFVRRYAALCPLYARPPLAAALHTLLLRRLRYASQPFPPPISSMTTTSPFALCPLFRCFPPPRASPVHLPHSPRAPISAAPCSVHPSGPPLWPSRSPPVVPRPVHPFSSVPITSPGVRRPPASLAATVAVLFALHPPSRSSCGPRRPSFVPRHCPSATYPDSSRPSADTAPMPLF